ncbi:hypothetical protein DFH06DRAFT_1331987 [Mycena polygramma]|nr:hypothetical protein DFH06DRAFT_1331987 [Mycena polygramma]
MNAMSIDDRLSLLRQTIKAGLPVTAGLHPVKAEDLVLYYDVDDGSNRIDLAQATEQDFAVLSSACGLSEGNDIGNARTMDATKFATRLDVVASGLLNVIATDVLQGENADGNKSLKAQLTRLKVYGPGASPNKYSESPQGNYMIGSLVVVLPAPHVGAKVLVQHQEASSALDPASELAAASSPAIWYMASYGDVPHTVEPLAAGHRVILTYTLFLVDPSVPSVQPPTLTSTERRLEDTLRALLADSAFLPAGGFLATGLAHTYPLPTSTGLYDHDPTAHWEGDVYVTYYTPERKWGVVLRALKGVDARLRDISTRIGLVSFVRPLYEGYEHKHNVVCDVLMDDVPDLFGIHEGLSGMGWGSSDADLGEETAVGRIMSKGTVLCCDASRLEELQPSVARKWGGDMKINVSQVPGVAAHWLSKLGEQNRTKTPYIGQDSMVEDMCGTVVLFIRVPAVGEGIRSF